MKDVNKSDIVEILKGTGYLNLLIKWFDIMPQDLSDDYIFRYDESGILGLYINGGDSRYIRYMDFPLADIKSKSLTQKIKSLL